jgi:hypothetical protein
VFVPMTSSTPVATWFWQTKGRSAERVILGVRPSEFNLLEFQSPSRIIFIGSHLLRPLSGRLIGPSEVVPHFYVFDSGVKHGVFGDTNGTRAITHERYMGTILTKVTQHV